VVPSGESEGHFGLPRSNAYHSTTRHRRARANVPRAGSRHRIRRNRDHGLLDRGTSVIATSGVDVIRAIVRGALLRHFLPFHSPSYAPYTGFQCRSRDTHRASPTYRRSSCVATLVHGHVPFHAGVNNQEPTHPLVANESSLHPWPPTGSYLASKMSSSQPGRL
jgi:hypothetical protein